MMGMPGMDEDFMKSALDYATAEHAFCVAARKTSTDPELKDAAAKMEDRSVETFKRLAAVAPSLGVKLPRDVTAKYKRDLSRLGDAGAGFDKEWLKDMIGLHHDSISLYTVESTHSHEPNYQQLAGKILPTEEADGNTLKALQARFGKELK